MCGIAGCLGTRDDALAQRMAGALAHRGPDGEGFHHGDGVSLAHRRLSVIDLATGAQPMQSADARYLLVYNGEIYNYKAIRTELESLGRSFRTQSDTEVLLEAFAVWGASCLSRLRGMYAFVIWDTQANTAFLARDPLGIKPLYYAQVGEVLYFASEIPALLEVPGLSRAMDYAALDDYLALLYTVPPRTLFEAIRQLPPGHCAIWAGGQLRAWAHWKPGNTEETRSETEWLEVVDAALTETLSLHRVSDVPVGAYLSGGLDSTAIAHYLASAQGAPLQTFTVGFGRDAIHYDESAEAAAFARKIGAEHHAITVDADVMEIFPAMLRHFGEPFGNPTALLSYVLAGAVKPWVKVVLSGDGGDELFGGYPRYRGMRWAAALDHVPRPIRAGLMSPLARMLPESTHGRHAWRRLREFAAGSLLPEADRYAAWVGYYGLQDRAALYTAHTRAAVGAHDGLGTIRDAYAACPSSDPAARAMHTDLQTFLPNNVLQYGDRMSMAHGLEVRVPFSDVALVDLLSRVPASLKVHGRHSKYLLRRCLAGKVPDEVVWRKKQGFNPPMGMWLNGPLRPLLDDYLSPTRIRARGLFEHAPIATMIEAHRGGRRDFTWHLWALLVLEGWMQAYLDGHRA